MTTTEADRELAKDLRIDIEEEIEGITEFLPKEKRAVENKILAAFAKRDSGKMTDTERLDWLDVNERLNSAEKGDQFQHCILNAQSNPTSISFGKTLRECIDRAMSQP
jgi:hypothetical protein